MGIVDKEPDEAAVAIRKRDAAHLLPASDVRCAKCDNTGGIPFAKWERRWRRARIALAPCDCPWGAYKAHMHGIEQSYRDLDPELCPQDATTLAEFKAAAKRAIVEERAHGQPAPKKEFGIDRSIPTGDRE